MEQLFQEITAAFQSGLTSIKEGDNPETVIQTIFKSWMQTYQKLISDHKKLHQEMDKNKQLLEKLGEDKKRLEFLYTSGLQLSSDLSMNDLMEKAIETVVKALEADAGFIVLLEDKGEEELLSFRNMDPYNETEPLELSRSVIKKAISSNLPYVLGGENDDEIKNAYSVIRLEISSAICVPLISNKEVLGAVYLDRRKQHRDFNEADLLFLISFARQIIKGIGISKEITKLEGRLISDVTSNEETLRQKFKSDELVGSSPLLLDVLRTACKISPTNAPVIILGENGTGKEMLARAIHNNSRRQEGPFVAINCSAIPKDLLESELFGYEKGAFTGAGKAKSGKIELANGGTMLFDEIGEMSIELQAKLLRVIQFHEVERLGGTESIHLDVRFLASTNKNLKTLVKEGKFREDLYYRFKVIELVMPPLRNHRDDMEDLIRFFINKHKADDESFTITDEAINALELYHWPGNIRELENIIRRALVLANNHEILLSDLPAEIYENTDGYLIRAEKKTLAEIEEEFRRNYIRKILRESSSKSEAANILGINRTHLHRIIHQLGIE